MIPHGTASKYTNHNCRCDRCRAAWREELRSLRARRALHGEKGGFVVPHGTDGGYRNYNCRCDACRTAATIAAYESRGRVARRRGDDTTADMWAGRVSRYRPSSS